MPSVNHLLKQLEESRFQFGPGADRKVARLLAEIGRGNFRDTSSLIRFHEAILFLRAFPQGPAVVRATEWLLNTFHRRVEELQRRGADMEDFEPIEVSGIAGTVMEDTLSFDLARWLVRRLPRNIDIDWEQHEDERALGATWPRFLPLLEEDACVEADVSWLRWLRAAQALPPKQSLDGAPTGSQLEWLVRRFEQTTPTKRILHGRSSGVLLSDREKAELYDSLRLPVRWRLANLRLSRTRNWTHPRTLYYHQGPLIARKEVSLEEELARPGLKLVRLPEHQGRAVMDTIRDVMLVRYRELYGTTLGDPRSVVKAELGRGVLIYMWNLLPGRRLPLRAYLAAFTVKNGVPVNYIEAIGLCEWIEVGFNTFYTFRGAETAWIFAQVLRCLHKQMGATCISIYPYQIGKDNEEALESGAFWFYRKLGFRPGRRDLLRLVEREERRIAANPKYRTPVRTLKRLAEGHLFYELPGSEMGAWDRFWVRNIGLGVNLRMGREFGGDSVRIRGASVASVSRVLDVHPQRWKPEEQRAFEDWALVLGLVPGLGRWAAEEKRKLVELIRAKAGGEMRYLRLTLGHARLRGELLRLGSDGEKAGPSLPSG
jgi:hypothetical protein